MILLGMLCVVVLHQCVVGFHTEYLFGTILHAKHLGHFGGTALVENFYLLFYKHFESTLCSRLFFFTLYRYFDCFTRVRVDFSIATFSKALHYLVSLRVSTGV